MLKAEGVVKHYGTGQNVYVALDGIDVEVGEGEFFSLLGASGCGKTTLLNIIAGFEHPTEGRISLRGTPITGPDRKRVMFFQDANEALFPWLTVAENVQFGLRVAGASHTERERVSEALIAMVGLAGHQKKLPHQLSGGMRQRVQIARALAIDPDMLLMDEPFAALDALTRRKMHLELLRIWSAMRKTVVFVTHDIGESIVLSDRVAVMSVGPRSRIKEVIEIGLPRPRNPADPSFGQFYHWIEELLAAEQTNVEERAIGAGNRPTQAL